MIGTIVGTSIINISCNFVSDILKSFGNRTRQKTIETEVSTFFKKFEGTDLDSATFEKFLVSNTNILNFKEYINLERHAKIEEFNLTLLSRNGFLEYVTNQAFDFIEIENKIKVSQKNIYEYMDYILKILESKLVKNLSDSALGTIYFIRESINELEQRLYENLKDSPKVFKNHDELEDIGSIYKKIVLKRNKKTHVYGIDDLELNSFYVFPELNIWKKEILEFENKDIIEWQNIFKESNIVSIIGGAGAGKSLFLKNLINKYEELNIFDARNLMPIYCDLKHYEKLLKNKTSVSIKDFLVKSMIDYSGMEETEITLELLEYFLNKGRCLILFDALDEVSKDYRNELNEKINAFFQITNLHNKICITSREIGFIPKTRITYKISPISIQQANQYIDKIISLKLFNKEYKGDFLNQCERIIDNRFLVSFLQLSLLVNIFKAEKKLPENKIELYEKCVEYISRKREREQKKAKFDFKSINVILNNDATFEKLSHLSRPNNNEADEKSVKSTLLSRYKRSYSSEKDAIAAIDEFLEFCLERTELYVEGLAEGSYKFYHRSFFEYYYARYLITATFGVDLLLEEIILFDVDSEIFDITTAILKKYHDERYIDFIEGVLLKIENLSMEDEIELYQFKKYSLILAPVIEAEYINSYFEFCFNERKNLCSDPKESLTRFVLPLLFRIKPEELAEKYLEFYEDEMIAGMILYKSTYKILDYISFGTLDILFSILSTILAEQDQIRRKMRNLSVEDVFEKIGKFIKYKENSEDVAKNMIEEIMDTFKKSPT